MDGDRTKQAQFRIFKFPLIVAAPALLALAAAIALSAQSIPRSASASGVSHRAAASASSRAASPALLVAAVRSAAASRAAVVRAASATVRATYTVRPGDTLSSIALRYYHDAGAWPVLYQANRDQVRWANLIQVGEVLTVPARSGHGPAAPVTRQAVIEQSASSAAPAPARPAASYSGESAFQRCVIARESGGNSQVMNSSGHYGLYQFSASTWAAYGGDPAEFGHATVAEQNAVFDRAMAEGGEFNWAPYDGC